MNIYDKHTLIIVVNYNSFQDTFECVTSIINSKESNYSILIIDNCSKKDDYDQLLSNIKDKNKILIVENIEIFSKKDLVINNKIMLLRLNRNVGFGEAHNIVISKFKEYNNLTDYVMILNNDTTVTEKFIHNLIIEDKGTKIGILTGKVKYYYGSGNDYAGGKLCYLRYGSFKHYHNNEIIDPTDVSFVSGCYFIIKKEILLELDYLFNPIYFFGYEDMELCIKINKMNYRMLYCPDAIIYHKKNRSGQRLQSSFKYYIANYSYNFYIQNLYRNNKFLYKFWYIIRKIYLNTLFVLSLHRMKAEEKKEILKAVALAYEFYKINKKSANNFKGLDAVQFYENNFNRGAGN